MTVTIGRGSATIGLDLYEAKAAEKKTEVPSVLFRLAETSTKLATEIDKTNARYL
jgi:hypothetical protein